MRLSTTTPRPLLSRGQAAPAQCRSRQTALGAPAARLLRTAGGSGLRSSLEGEITGSVQQTATLFGTRASRLSRAPHWVDKSDAVAPDGPRGSVAGVRRPIRRSRI